MHELTDSTQWLEQVAAIMPAQVARLTRSDLIGLSLMNGDETARAIAALGADAIAATARVMAARPLTPLVAIYHQWQYARVMAHTPAALRDLLARCVAAPDVRAVFVLERVAGSPFACNQVAAWHRPDAAVRWVEW